MPDVAQDSGEVAGTALGIADLDGGHLAGLLVGLLHGDVGKHERRPGGRRHLPRHAVHGEEVGPVGGHLDVEDGVAQAERLADVVAGRHGRWKQQDSLVARRHGELHRRTHHPVRDDAADLARRDRLVERRHARPRPGEGNQVARAHVPHPHDDLPFARAGRHPGEAQLVGVGMVAHLEHARSDDPRQPLPRPKDVLDLGAARRQQLGELLRGQVGGTQLAKP